MVLAALFFYAHQAWSTGFFTPGFGGFEALWLYGSIFLAMVGPIIRSATGRRNPARIPEVLVSIFWIAGSITLLISFPFNFAHFADVVPELLRFLVSWITNDIAWVLMAIGTAGGFVFVGVTIFLYIKVKALLKSGCWERSP
ncbi:MAG: hypothetical protein AB1351_00750 [Thermoproteota archaeon]